MIDTGVAKFSHNFNAWSEHAYFSFCTWMFQQGMRRGLRSELCGSGIPFEFRLDNTDYFKYRHKCLFLNVYILPIQYTDAINCRMQSVLYYRYDIDNRLLLGNDVRILESGTKCVVFGQNALESVKKEILEVKEAMDDGNKDRISSIYERLKVMEMLDRL